VLCKERITETAADPSYVYQIFSCIGDNTQYIDRLRFFKQVKDEIDRLISRKQSPEIVALIADWGQGKSTFLDIIEEYGKRANVNITKIPFINILKETFNVTSFRNGIYLIDEVESSIDYFDEYKNEIKEFWSQIKELANTAGNSVIYLSMTPSAYSKIFGIGGQLYSLFPETYQALLSRIREVRIENPSKLEFMLMIKCMLEMANIRDLEILKYLDLPFWVIDPERRKYVRFFNEILCENYPDVEKIFNELARSDKGIQLNSENETVKLDVLTTLENSLDKEEIRKLHKLLMSRIFVEKELIIPSLEKNIVKGFLVPYSKWVEAFPKISGQNYIEDFLLTFDEGSFYIFISDDIEKVIYEGIDSSKVKEVVNKLRHFSKSEAYSLNWSYFESIVNTNVGGLVVEFKSREVRDKALQFVNSNITDRSKELDSLEHLMEIEGILILERKLIGDHTRILKISRGEGKDILNIIITKPISEEEINQVINEIKNYEDIIHGSIIISSIIEKIKLFKLLDSISIPWVEITLTTPKKRQLLYLLFSKIYNQSKIRQDIIDLRLGDIKNSIFSLILKITENLNLKQLPVLKNKRLVQSFNWIIFYPSTKIANIYEVFEKVNEIVNEKFRIYGSKQFHLEDIETPETFLDDIVNYFVSNKIIKMESNYIDFNSFTGEYLTNFSKLFAGFIKQKYKQEAEEIVSNYILSLADLVDNKRKGNLLSFAYQLFSPDKKVGQNPTLDFLVYASLISGELSKFLNYSLIYDKVVEQVRKIEERLNSPYLNYGYFITAKKRGAGIRSIAEMKEVIDIYKKGCVENKDLRLCFCSLYLSKLYLTLLKETEKSVNEVENIIAEISKKLEIVNIAKKYLKIEEKIEEIEKITTIITSLKENFNSYINSLSKKIQEINEEGRTENFKKYLDYLLKVINAEDNLNLYYILFKSIREALNGTLISSEDLRETIFEDIASLSKIGSQLNTIESIVSEIEKIGPELPKLRENIQRKEERISQLIQEIKNLVGDYDSI